MKPILLFACVAPLLGGCSFINTFDYDVSSDTGPADTGVDADTGSGDTGGGDTGATDTGGGDATPDAGDTGSDAGVDTGPPDCSEPDVIYVTESGDDADDGTIDAPMRSIAAAMATVGGTPGKERVFVGAGSFETTYESTSEINLVDGVTLRGGHSDDFCTYDPATYVTSIEQGFLGSVSIDPMVSPIVSIMGDDLENPVILEGFLLSIGEETDDNHAGIRLRNTDAIFRDVIVADGDGREMIGAIVEGAATLTMERVTLAMDNASHGSTGIYLIDVGEATLSEVVVDRPTLDSSLASYGIRVEYRTNGPEYSVDIQRSRIHGGRGGSNSHGILISDTQPTPNPIAAFIANNVIHGGESGSVGWGIDVVGRSRNVTIYNNTIYTGENGGFGYGIDYTYNFSGPDIRNNVIFSGVSSQFCIRHQGGDWDGTNTVMSNNLFFDCPLALFYDTDRITTAATLNALRNSAANQTASTVPLANLTGPDLLTGTMGNNDWGFADGAPCSFTDGAFPTSDVTVDYFGNPRDGTPSIGAIEFAGTCTP